MSAHARARGLRRRGAPGGGGHRPPPLLAKLHTVKHTSFRIFGELEELCDPPEEQYADRQLFEDQYYRLVSTARQLVTSHDASINHGQSGSATSSNPALVKVLDKKGNQHDARLLLDNGSTANFISQDLCSKLGLSSRATHSTVSEERACEDHFLSTTYRNEEGRFVVSMPLKEDPNKLGDSYFMAKSRFSSLERRFQRDPIYKQRYIEFIDEYEKLGHMTKNTTKVSSNQGNVNYYLPHHGIIRESSTTTKLRTVFDASAATTSGLSLNDIQMVGPTVQDDLLSILIRFRQHRFVISGDIEKMYRAIEINSNQRSLQQILFRSDTSQPIQIYTLNSVTYGTASAPYLATKCLSTLASNASNITVKNSILRDFYVDDYLSGGATIEDVIKQSQEVISILSSAKFNLRKFQSNNLEILQAVTNNNVDHNNMLHLSESKINNEPSRTLGLHWICDSDVLAFTINIENKEKMPLKRPTVPVPMLDLSDKMALSMFNL
ncbi:unnamed protein product [Plutella xylostella]|uniref:(diamondback moth) hypothetical protein n=1 Tax=Plutella xylostella TaxID=51655 RepID=A0A8S4G0X0_PLUXY|nr:unnamed protein product [Plutella xylostella]